MCQKSQVTTVIWMRLVFRSKFMSVIGKLARIDMDGCRTRPLRCCLASYSGPVALLSRQSGVWIRWRFRDSYCLRICIRLYIYTPS